MTPWTLLKRDDDLLKAELKPAHDGTALYRVIVDIEADFEADT